MKQAIINARIYDFYRYIENGFVIYDDKIIDVGAMKDFIDRGYAIIDAKHCLVMPGLVCGHTHIYSTFARGLSLPFDPHDFQDILDQLWWKIDRQLDNEANRYSALVAGTDFLLNGVTTIIDHHASGEDITGSLDAISGAVAEVGLRGIYAFEVSDRFPVNKAIEENVSFFKHNDTSYRQGLFGLHASLSLSDDTLRKVQASKGNAPIHIHVGESALDEAKCVSQYGLRVVERLASFGLINKDSILVHCVHVNDREIAIIKNLEAIIAVNISSNMNNAVGLPDVIKLMDNGIPVMIGNDGLGTSMADEYRTLYFAMHHRYEAPTKFTLDRLLKMINATYEYASRRLKIKLGRIEPGFAADLLIVPYEPSTKMDEENAFGHLFFGLFNGFKPRDVLVNGRMLVHDYKLTSRDKDAIHEEAQKVSKRLWERIKQER